MLNIYKLKKKNNTKKIMENFGDLSGKIIELVPSNKEWFNSIYTFNKNNLRSLSIIDKIIYTIIKSYFSMFDKKIEKTKVRGIDLSARNKLARRIWVSKPEIKHTNDKIIITLYLYNRQYNYLSHKLLYMINFLYQDNFYNKLLLINKYFTPFLLRDIIKYIKNILDTEITYLRFKQIILFNKFKFNSFTVNLKYILKKIYNKDIELNLISLKTFSLSSNILSQIITKKIRKKKNNPLRVLKASLRKIRTPILNQRTIKREETKLIEVQNILIANLQQVNNNNIGFYLNNNLFNNNKIEDLVLNNTKYKVISGITLKASGRITRRIIAERAIYKIRSKGSLKNINSSYKGLSSPMVRGYKKSNIDSTLTHSITHVGAFGLKGWISNY